MTAIPAPAPRPVSALATLVTIIGTVLVGSRRYGRAAAGPVFDVLGLAAVCVGAFLLATWLGWVVVGLSLLVVRHVLIPAGSDG
jgi:hypothetical protein